MIWNAFYYHIEFMITVTATVVVVPSAGCADDCSPLTLKWKELRRRLSAVRLTNWSLLGHIRPSETLQSRANGGEDEAGKQRGDAGVSGGEKKGLEDVKASAVSGTDLRGVSCTRTLIEK